MKTTFASMQSVASQIASTQMTTLNEQLEKRRSFSEGMECCGTGIAGQILRAPFGRGAGEQRAKEHKENL